MSATASDSAAPAKRIHRRRGASALPYLLILGVGFLALTFSGTLRSWVDEHVGIERLMLAGLGFVCLHAAFVAFELARSRERLLDLLGETMRALRAGAAATTASASPPDLRRNADAIDILVNTMQSANVEARSAARANLVRLTACDLGDDPARWSQWWSSQKAELGDARRGDPK